MGIEKGLVEHELTLKELEALEFSGEKGVEGITCILKNLKIGEYFAVKKISTNQNPILLNECLDVLRKMGHDIGKGNVEYGYKMPLPEKGESYRKLIVFRRR